MGARVRCRACGTENQAGFGTCFSCGAPLSAATAIRKGSVLAGRYEILSPLGRGGMGVVYKAHDRSLDELVAVKLLREDLVATADLTRRFLSEIKLARRVRHPNVCAIHEYGEDAGTRYIAMEFIDGVNLRQIIEEHGRLDVGEAAEIGAQIARGLAAIHGVGIVHRDLKTPNIMRDVRGAVRLMDFGIAKSLDSETHATATGSILGTPEYMSPEQARGEKVDVRSDIYSLGIVVFELMTGHVPFKAETPLGVLMKHISDEPPWADLSAHSAVSDAARDVLERALAKEPQDRFRSAADMADALGHLSADAATGTVRPAAGFVPARQRGATALQPVEVPNPTATHVPTAVPTRAAASPTTSAAPSLVALPSAGTSKAVWVAASAAAVVLAAWAIFVRPGSEAPAAAPGSLSAAANVATVAEAGPQAVAPPVTTPLVAAPPETAPATKMPVKEAAPLETGRNRPIPTPKAEPTRGTRGALVPERPAAPIPTAEPAPTVREPEVTAPPPEPEPTQAPPVVLAAAPAPTAAPVAGRPTPVGRGLLLIQVKPEAEITIDGESVGRMGKYTRPLTVGVHTVVFTHPKYEPLSRQLNIGVDERVRLVVDLKDEAVARKK